MRNVGVVVASWLTANLLLCVIGPVPAEGQQAHAQPIPPTVAVKPHTLTKAQIDLLLNAQPSHAKLKIVGPGNVQQLPQGDQSLQLAAGQYVKSNAVPRTDVIDGRKRYVLPIRFTGFNLSGHTVVHLRPVLEVENKAMQLDPKGEVYQAGVRVGIQDENGHGEPQRLVPLVLHLSADHAEIDPHVVPIKRTEVYRTVQVKSTAPGDSVEVTLWFRAERVSASIGVERPSIVVDHVPEKLDGLGVGYETINVHLSENAGPKVRTVDVSFDPGQANPSSVEVSAEKHASIQIRTASLQDSATLTLSGTGLIPTTKNVTLIFPFALLVATVIGALIGAISMRLVGAKSQSRVRIQHFLAGVIAGIVGAAIYLLGVNVTGVPIAVMNNELAIAVVAALTAMGGAKGLAKLSGGKAQGDET